MMPNQPTTPTEQAELDKARRALLARAYALILSPAWNTPQEADTPAEAPDDAPSDAEPTQPHDG